MRTTGRRTALRTLTVLAGAALLPACGGGGDEGPGETLSCRATGDARSSYAYVDQSPRDDQRCANCAFWQPGPEGACGGCQSVEGRIHPAGWCTLWAETG